MIKRKIMMIILIFVRCVSFLDGNEVYDILKDGIGGKEGFLLIVSFNHFGENQLP